jgi:hypothetical protein
MSAKKLNRQRSTNHPELDRPFDEAMIAETTAQPNQNAKISISPAKVRHTFVPLLVYYILSATLAISPIIPPRVAPVSIFIDV